MEKEKLRRKTDGNNSYKYLYLKEPHCQNYERQLLSLCAATKASLQLLCQRRLCMADLAYGGLLHLLLLIKYNEFIEGKNEESRCLLKR